MKSNFGKTIMEIFLVTTTIILGITAIVLFLYFVFNSKKDLVKSSREVYVANLIKVHELSYQNSDDKGSARLTEMLIMNAELKEDTLLYKIHMIEKRKYESIRQLKEIQISKIIAEQDSLLKNDTILINRGIKISDSLYDIDLKFEYYKSIKNGVIPKPLGEELFTEDDDWEMYKMIYTTIIND